MVMKAHSGLHLTTAGTRVVSLGRVKLSIWCLLILALLMWGPPRLRLGGRDAITALDNPFDLDWQGLLQVGVAAAGALVLGIALVNATRSQNSRTALITGWPVRWYLALSVLALSSSLWSVRPTYTAFFGIKLLVCWAVPCFALSSASSESTAQLLRCIKIVSACQVVGLLVCAIVVPDAVGADVTGVGYRLTGMPLVIDFGGSAALWLIFVIAEVLEPERRGQRILQFLSLGPIFCNLYLARTRSLWLGIIAAMICLVVANRRHRGLVLTAVFASVISGLLLLAASGITEDLFGYFLRGQSEKEITSGSGRVQAFSFLLEVWRENPIIGVGYAAGSRLNLVRFMATSGLGIGAGHDVVSRTLADLGAVGLAVVILLYASSAWRVMIALHSSWDPGERRLVGIASAVVALAFAGALTSSGIMDPDANWRRLWWFS